MANQVPQSGLSPEAGGLLLTELPLELVAPKHLNETGAFALARQLGTVQQTDARKLRFPKYLGDPDVDFVDEDGDYNEDGAEWDEDSISVKKIGVTVPFTEEQLEDLKDLDVDPLEVIGQDLLDRKFTNRVDAHILGRTRGANVASKFDFDFRTGVSQSVELDTSKNDGLSLAISDAMGEIEEHGYTPNGVLVPSDARKAVRNARRAADGSADPLYAAQNDPFHGLVPARSQNLDRLTDPAGAGVIKGVVGDFSTLRVIIRKDVEVKLDPYTGFKKDRINVKFRMRLAVWCTDPNAICLITDETSSGS